MKFMQGYESVFITDPDLSEEALSGILDKVKNTVTHQGGAIQQYHHWGRRRLAYPINKKTHGVYHLLYITGDEEMLKELNQQYRFIEEIMRFQTIKIEDIQLEYQRFLELRHQEVAYEKTPPDKETKPESNKVTSDAKTEEPETDASEEKSVEAINNDSEETPVTEEEQNGS
jgi:small subunit ribosomal protein S6